ncbi:bZIP transcription factor bZIP-1 [Penicillium verhagenii]|uniref:bZIP transcription factor bZIP-1 n=1 Tax=Penicillium verhagenii TaxID=1562060 RepID=UPI0025457915|nr:bZIP transcription factor bZIP-1 [Penicillium verhagenii]KAJ5948300.1 bZIP transcription factor bZIP-1 [Penicillium verhagenii]
MATLAEHPSHHASPMPTMPTSYDQELDSFINFDQLAYSSADAARAKVALTSQPSVASTDFSASDTRSASFASSGQSPIAFQAPSHHYEEHRQQTGLPPGALSMTYNQQQQQQQQQVAHPMGFNGNQGFQVNGDMYAQMKREEAPFDFSAAPTRNPSEMDIESDGMNSTPYYFSANPGNKSQFVDPNALGGHELAQAGPSTQVGRMYPGMHQQQAAMAKAAQQQKHNEMVRHQMQQRRVEEAATPMQTRGPRNPDPVVEERISRLLQQMRANAVAAGEASPSPSSGLPQMAKARKDEADMDEDERLLASEEGKKLSSKERRQLRNKVSARAFRSRRKEYIGQLESEVAARTNEAHEARLQNRALYEENARLNDLARMLLGSPHFANFLNEMPDSVPAQVPAHQQPQQQPQQAPKEPSAPRPQEFQMQQHPQPNMVMVPNQGMDASMLNSGWNSGIDMNYGNTPVFAVLDVPQGPCFDAEVLSGKSSLGSSEPAKDEAPVFDHPQGDVATPKSDIGVANSDIEIDESDPAFALFIDSPASFAPSDISSDGVQTELVVDAAQASAIAQARFNTLCSSIEAAFDRVSHVTSYLQ